MGVTLRNKYSSIDLGYGGFARLRETIAKLYSEEFATLYKDWTSRKIDDKEGNEKLEMFFVNGIFKEKDEVILDFLFASDCSGKMDLTGCRRLLNLIKDYDDDILYGYSGRPDCAKFKDFKELVESSVKMRTILRWS